VSCSELQLRCSVLQLRCSVVQCVAVALRCATVCLISLLRACSDSSEGPAAPAPVLYCFAVSCSCVAVALQCVAVCCSDLQLRCGVLQCVKSHRSEHIATLRHCCNCNVCCSMQSLVVCCSVIQLCCSVLHLCCSCALQRAAVC